MKLKRIYIELSNYCNLNCLFCTPENKNNRILSFEDFSKAFMYAKDFTDEICLHVLGEPLIHKDFIKIAQLVNSYNKNIMLSTNGRLITKTNNLMDVFIKTWNISLHSSYDLTYDKKKEYILDMLDFIKEYRKKFDATFHLRLWADSNDSIKKSNLEIKQILFNYFNYTGSDDKRIRLDEKIIISYENEFEWPTLDNNECSHAHCLGGKTHVAILSNLDVVMCCLDWKGLTKIGNLKENSLEYILNNDPYQSAIKEFQNNKCYFELCKHCTYKKGI